MIIPLANGIFNDKINIEDFYFKKSPNKFKNLNFQEVI